MDAANLAGVVGHEDIHFIQFVGRTWRQLNILGIGKTLTGADLLSVKERQFATSAFIHSVSKIRDGIALSETDTIWADRLVEFDRFGRETYHRNFIQRFLWKEQLDAITDIPLSRDPKRQIRNAQLYPEDFNPLRIGKSISKLLSVESEPTLEAGERLQSLLRRYSTYSKHKYDLANEVYRNFPSEQESFIGQHKIKEAYLNMRGISKC